MIAQRLQPNDLLYPSQLLVLESPPALTVIGSLDVLQQQSWLAVFCSSRCPGSLIIQAQDVAHELVKQNTAVIGGFHSTVERELLRVLLRGTNSIIVVPARGLTPYRIPPDFQSALESGRLLLLTPFSDDVTRSSENLAWKRNLFVSDFAESVLVVHASTGSATERLVRLKIQQKKFFTLPNKANALLSEIGATPWNQFKETYGI
jgi:predicted Rossmann fold nucleotide-binding protein DprA/Smf involved in DNA uptake